MYFVLNNTNVQGAKCLLKDANTPVLVFLTLALMLQPIIAAKTTWRLTRDLVLMNLYTHEALYEGLFHSIRLRSLTNHRYSQYM